MIGSNEDTKATWLSLAGILNRNLKSEYRNTNGFVVNLRLQPDIENVEIRPENVSTSKSELYKRAFRISVFGFGI